MEQEQVKDEGNLGINLDGAAATPVTGNAELEELRRQLQSSKVEAGRVKAMAQQLKEKDDEIAALRKQLEDAQNQKPRNYMDDIPEEMRELVDEAQVNAVGRMMDKRMRERDEAARQREAERDSQIRSARMKELMSRIDREFPGFLKDTNEGGDKKEPWEKFMRVYGASVRSALDSFDFESLSSIILLFYREIGVPVNREANTAITPRPTSADASQYGGNDKPVYSFADYQAKLEQAGIDYRAGKIDRQKYAAVREELDSALREGRVSR